VVPAEQKIQSGFSPVTSLTHTAIRQFQPGSIIGYSYRIFNPQLDKKTGQPNLTVQVRLFRDGQVVTDNGSQPLQGEQQTDLTRIPDYGYLRLQPELQTGDYALQVIVTDANAKQVTSQWIDFEVVN
jgi:5-hydroxyisourate hydrolase-like protein (transthyretin family)